jgi:retinol-binding protein 3
MSILRIARAATAAALAALAGPIPLRAQGPSALDAEMRARVIDGAIRELRENYVFPETAERMATAVRERQKRGEYDAVTDGAQFASLLTRHFREVSNDKHLRVNYFADGAPVMSFQNGPEQRERMRQRLLADNCGFERAERLEGNIGYLKFNFFADTDACGGKASEVMSSLAGVKALVVDLRTNGGGQPAMVAHVSSYLFSTRTHLNDIWERRTNETRQFFTNPDLPGKKIADDVPVYVLTSTRTFSGAEEFSYNLKNLRRATLIGETTGGGAHPVQPHRLTDHFVIGVPFARAINPITKTNWEGTGVVPDVKVPSADALTTALKLIAERKIP